MEFRLLGPLEVVDGDRSLALGGLKQRALLAVLLIHANEIVSVDRLTAALWGDSPPQTAAKSIQIYVSRLRKELGGSRLATRSPGYVLHLDPPELDSGRFERLLGQARRADPVTAAEKLRQALALWRGPPLGDLAYEPFAQTEIVRLEELRVVALEERIDADLAAGRHADIVGELETLIAEYPLRERLRGQLMLALYRAGRQAEALHAYRMARAELSEELGLEPGDQLKLLERAILEQDPSLVLPAAGPRAPPRPHGAAPERSLLVVPTTLDRLDALLSLAAPLLALKPMELIVAAVVAASDVAGSTSALAERGDALRAGGVPVRTAAFSSPAPGEDVVRLASRQRVDLLLMDAGHSRLDGEVGVMLEEAPCDVALLVEAGGPLRPGPVIVPFGAAEHDWAALALGTWVACATDSPLRLIGAAFGAHHGGRNASRLLADASLIVQRRAGIIAEPLLARPGRKGIAAQAEGAGLLVVGLSDRWRHEGLGPVRTQLAEAPPAPTVFVRGGLRSDGAAPEDTLTGFRWSLTATGP
jgi:DNA-binding SARP family transcriptional activator